MHPLQSRSLHHDVPSSSSHTQSRLTASLEVLRPTSCREIGTAIGRGSLHIANTISLRNGQLTSREISYPSYQVARTHIDPRVITNCTLYHLDVLLIHKHSLPNLTINRIFVDCHAALYSQIFIYLIDSVADDALWIFDDMLTASTKSPGLEKLLDSLGYHTIHLPSEGSDRLLAASKEQSILQHLIDQKA